MRIALIARRFDPAGGGTERDLIATARALRTAGYDVTIYAAEIRGQTSEFAVRQVRSLGIGRTLRLLSFAARAAAEARRDGASLVFSFARIANADILRSGGSAHSIYIRSARLWQGPVAAAAMRSSPYHRAQIAIERRGFASPTLKRAIAVSELVRRDLLSTFGLAAATAVTLYNGVDLERFRPDARAPLRNAVRRVLRLPETAPIVAFVGNGFARKGLRFLIEAWPQLRSEAILVVAGSDQSVGKYRRLARRRDIAERVRFVGVQAQIERLFAAVDAFALPSLFEPFGNVVMEAMAAGLPVLCSSACGAAELVAPALRELVVADPTDVGELAARLNALIEAREDLSSIARATAEQFTWESHDANLLRIIRDL
ncbi:MAG TPA: glycosyltransferase family 4 protein [Candidatus Binataceae bacterium]|nr:glycosyltransferase family 4 protein [Candidatus Binataceae bacterium]